jgi:hypothetical protein
MDEYYRIISNFIETFEKLTIKYRDFESIQNDYFELPIGKRLQFLKHIVSDYNDLFYTFEKSTDKDVIDYLYSDNEDPFLLEVDDDIYNPIQPIYRRDLYDKVNLFLKTRNDLLLFSQSAELLFDTNAIETKESDRTDISTEIDFLKKKTGIEDIGGIQRIVETIKYFQEFNKVSIIPDSSGFKYYLQDKYMCNKLLNVWKEFFQGIIRQKVFMSLFTDTNDKPCDAEDINKNYNKRSNEKNWYLTEEEKADLTNRLKIFD